MLDAGYVHEKLGKTLDLLAFGKAAIRGRVISAVCELSNLSNWEPPQEHRWIKVEMARIVAALTVEPDTRGEGTIAATVHALSEDDAVDWARKIADFARKARESLD